MLVMDHADRDEVAKELLRFRDEAGDALADLIDTLTMHPEERRRVVRMTAIYAATHGVSRSTAWRRLRAS